MNHDRNKKNKHTGNTANAFLSSGTICLTNPIEAKADQKKATVTITILAIRTCFKKRQIIAAILRGKRQ